MPEPPSPNPPRVCREDKAACVPGAQGPPAASQRLQQQLTASKPTHWWTHPQPLQDMASLFKLCRASAGVKPHGERPVSTLGHSLPAGKCPGGKASSLWSRAGHSLPAPRLAPGSVSDGLFPPLTPGRPPLPSGLGQRRPGGRPPRAPPGPAC